MGLTHGKHEMNGIGRRTWTRQSLVAHALALSCLFGVMTTARAADEAPAWAYPMNPTPPPPLAPDDGQPIRVPDSDRTYTVTQIRTLYGVPDWHPGDHPPMPSIVADGRKPAAFACGYCHLPNGLGRPENASLAGLPVAYMEQQFADYRDGTRGTAKPTRIPAAFMIKNSKEVTDAEVREAVRYFASLTPRPWVRVVESATAPVTHVSVWALLPNGTETEPLGDRIIEVPVDPKRFEARDARASFVAYVPIGSIKKGEELVTRGSAGGVPCGTCHGPGLRGVGPVPGIAGRSPTYIVRQLYEFQHGIRAGAWSPLMAPQVKELSQADMIAIAAFAGSLEP